MFQSVLFTILIPRYTLLIVYLDNLLILSQNKKNDNAVSAYFQTRMLFKYLRLTRQFLLNEAAIIDFLFIVKKVRQYFVKL